MSDPSFDPLSYSTYLRLEEYRPPTRNTAIWWDPDEFAYVRRDECIHISGGWMMANTARRGVGTKLLISPFRVESQSQTLFEYSNGGMPPRPLMNRVLLQWASDPLV